MANENYPVVFKEEYYLHGKFLRTEFGSDCLGASFRKIDILAEALVHDTKRNPDDKRTGNYKNMQGETLNILIHREDPIVLRRTGLSGRQFSQLVKKVSSLLDVGEK